MLGKLMKHEYRATARILLPMYGIVLVLAMAANIATRFLMESSIGLFQFFGISIFVGYTISLWAAGMLSVLLSAKRFYSSLLTDEGYVMMTLPVSVHSHVISKIMVSVSWFFLMGMVMFVSFWIVAYDVGFTATLFEIIQMLFDELTMEIAINGGAFLVEIIVLAFVSGAGVCLQFYAALAVGHSFPSYKILLSVVALVVLQWILQLVFVVIMLLGQGLDFNLYFLDGPAYIGHIIMIGCIFVSVVYSAIYYWITVYFMKHKLNLA